MISDRISLEDRTFLSQLPLLFAGTADDAGRPWVSVLVGERGFVKVPDETTLGVGARPTHGDPLAQTLIVGAQIATLGIDSTGQVQSRANGKIARVEDSGFEILVGQFDGNSPKHLQAQEPIAADIVGNIRHGGARRGKALNRAEASLVARSDTFFMASRCPGDGADSSGGIDLSHRVGNPGFVIVSHESELLIPVYAGDFTVNTLGNIPTDRKCGLLFLDFDNGDMLQISGKANLLGAPHHTSRFPGADRVICLQIDEIFRSACPLPLSGRFEFPSPLLTKAQTSADPPSTGPGGRGMRLLSVNLSMPEAIIDGDRTVVTGIGKRPADDRVMLHRLNLEGDGQADLAAHGGSFRAVYAYSIENYEYWRRELGQDNIPFGMFGENLTVEGMLEEDVCIGDVYRVRSAVVEVSQPRVPCYKLAMRMGVNGFAKRFLKSGRLGFYCRVLEVGQVGKGDGIELVSRDPEALTVQEVANLLYFDKEDLAGARKALNLPALSHGWKGSFAERLTKAEISKDVNQDRG